MKTEMQAVATTGLDRVEGGGCYFENIIYLILPNDSVAIVPLLTCV
jgi:hypothetical protein